MTPNRGKLFKKLEYTRRKIVPIMKDKALKGNVCGLLFIK